MLHSLSQSPSTSVRAVAERGLNLAFGGTVLWWTAAGLMAAPSWVPVHAAIAALNLTVAFLMANREPEQKAAAWTDIGLALPAVLSGALALRLAADPTAWGLLPQALFIGGTVATIASLWTLGKSFSVLPGVRSIVDHGPYGWVRHPAYSAQLLMVTAGALVVGGPAGLALVAGTVAALVVRIRVEERLLLGEPEYAAYADRVTSRMVPGVW